MSEISDKIARDFFMFIQAQVPDDGDAVVCLAAVVGAVLHTRFGLITRERALMGIAKGVLASFEAADERDAP
jgi:hypothetical protein